MMKLNACQIVCLLVCGAALQAAETPRAPIRIVSATADSFRPGDEPAKAVDGVVSNASRWVAATSSGWLEIQLNRTHAIAGLHLHSGFNDTDAVTDFSVKFWAGGAWRDIPSATVTNNQATALALPFDSTVEVVTDRLRIEIQRSPKSAVRIKELVVWPAGSGDLPALAINPARSPESPARAAASSQSAIVPLYLNQSGFNLGKPKRFTAPTLPDGTAFVVRPASPKSATASGAAPVFRGIIQQHLGDFSAFDPVTADEFVVQAGGLVSVPFRFGHGWLERVSYQNSVNFMIDTRHHVGNDRSVCTGSFGWRDDHHFGWELHALVPQLLSNPSAYTRLPRQIRYEPPDQRRLWGALDPYADDAPDLVKLIHWGADIIVTQKLSHELLKSQLAYFLYAWPWLRAWLPEQNYRAVLAYTFATWSHPDADRRYPYDLSPEHDLLALKTRIGDTKGQLPPGFSVQPNLLLHEVALRENRPDADLYLAAALRQAEWLVANLDWENPLHTKGQRMSEFLTLTGLAHLLTVYPDRAPPGLRAKLATWADVALRRSDNLWDFRKLSDASDQWTPVGEKPTMWNEPGNVVGLPAIIYSVLPHLDDPAKRARLEQIAWAHFDQLFGRNPVGRHFSFDAPREVEGVEHGWFKFHVGGIGRLADARFVLDGSPKNVHYPHHPERGDAGWTEGWIQHNLPFNLSLAYLAHADTRVELRREGTEVIVRLQAPLNFDPAVIETGLVDLLFSSGKRATLVVTEDSANSRWFTARLPVPATENLTVSYGWGYFARSARLSSQ